MTTTSRTYAALAGLLATIAALSIGELAAGFVTSWYSPVEAVGDTFVDFTPRPLKDFAIATFGTTDKVALIFGTLIITLIYGTALGIIGRRRLPIAWGGVALFGVIGVAASAYNRDLASGVPSILAAVAGIPAMTLLLRTAPAKATPATPAAAPASGAATRVTPAPARSTAATVPAADTQAAAAPPPPRGGEGADTVSAADGGIAGDDRGVAGRSTPADRRKFLALSGGVAVASAAAVAGGRGLISQRGSAIADTRDDIASQIGQTAAPEASEGASEALRPLGLVNEPLPAVPAGVDFGIDGVAPFVTPDPDFYRIDIALSIPQVDPDAWSLRIHGMVDTELEFTYEDLLRRPDLIESDITMTCVSNEVGGRLMSSGRWTGIPLRNLLEEAGVQSGADQLVGRDGDGFTTGFPTEIALEPDRDAILALLFDGEPLSPERGFPARVVVPGLYGYVSATKWITEMELTTFADFDQYWVERGWDQEAPIKTQSRIDVPQPLQRVPAGDIVVAGVAWAQRRGIERVEVRVDEGEWMEAELAEELNVDTWRQWRMTWTPAGPGNYSLTVRATDTTGEVQTEERQPPFPNGASGWNNLLVTVIEA